MPENRQTVHLRLICLNPPPLEVDGAPAEFGLQDKDGKLLAGAARGNDAVLYEFSVDVLLDGSFPNFLGPYTHGTPLGRFLYLSYRRAGSPEWIKRLKIRLGTITRDQVDEALQAGGVIEGTVDGRSAGKANLTDGWTVR